MDLSQLPELYKTKYGENLSPSRAREQLPNVLSLVREIAPEHNSQVLVFTYYDSSNPAMSTNVHSLFESTEERRTLNGDLREVRLESNISPMRLHQFLPPESQLYTGEYTLTTRSPAELGIASYLATLEINDTLPEDGNKFKELLQLVAIVPGVDAPDKTHKVRAHELVGYHVVLFTNAKLEGVDKKVTTIYDPWFMPPETLASGVEIGQYFCAVIDSETIPHLLYFRCVNIGNKLYSSASQEIKSAPLVEYFMIRMKRYKSIPFPVGSKVILNFLKQDHRYPYNNSPARIRFFNALTQQYIVSISPGIEMQVQKEELIFDLLADESLNQVFFCLQDYLSYYGAPQYLDEQSLSIKARLEEIHTLYPDAVRFQPRLRNVILETQKQWSNPPMVGAIVGEASPNKKIVIVQFLSLYDSGVEASAEKRQWVIHLDRLFISKIQAQNMIDRTTFNLAHSCVYCLDKRATEVYLPCSHLVACEECSEKYFAEHKQTNCPICRNVVMNISLRTFGARVFPAGTLLEGADHPAASQATRSCASCKVKPGTKRCDRCRSVVYCSIKCQKHDWKNGHKQRCKEPDMRGPVEIVGKKKGLRKD